MSRARRFFFMVVGLGILAVFLPAEALAFCRTTVCPDCPLDDQECPTGIPIRWPRACVSYDVQFQASRQVSFERVTQTAAAAFSVWQTAACQGGASPSIRIADFGPVACKQHEYNQTDGNANIIMFHDDAWPYDEVSNAIALTTVTFNYQTGDIYDVDMEINGTIPLSTEDEPPRDAFDLQSVMAHEAGHFFGLAHSLDPEATMRARYSPNDMSFRDLAADDIAGICAVYPPDQPSSKCDYTPRGGFSSECGIFPTAGGSCSVSHGLSGSTGAGVAHFALPLLLAFMKRRERRTRGPAI